MRKAVIVILNYNGVKMLKRFLPSVMKYSAYDIVVIDNASKDTSIDFLRTTFPQINIVQLPENLGYSGGYNAGLKKLMGLYAYYILLNSDIEVTPDWDIDMVGFLESRSQMAVAQPKILSLVHQGHFDYAGASGGFLDSLGYPFCRGRILNEIEVDSGQYQSVLEIDWASGACFCVRAACFHERGGFEDSFFAHMEEIDLCWRLRNAGFSIGVNPEVRVYHLGGATLEKSNPKKTYLNFRNSLLMLYKNLMPAKFYRIFFLRVLLDMAALIHMLFLQGASHSLAVFNAYFDFFKEKDRMQKDVTRTSSRISSMDNAVFSIIFVYYFRRKKRYVDLD